MEISLQYFVFMFKLFLWYSNYTCMEIVRGIKNKFVVSLTKYLPEEKSAIFLKNFIEWLLQLPHHFKQECNDPLKNDTMENLDEETMTGLKEMGAFGLQVLRFLISGNKQKIL